MLDEELIEQLEKSRTIVGEHSPIAIDFDGEILSGRHRKEASWEKTESIDSRLIAEKLGVTVAIAKEVVRTHFNLQRKPTREETQASLLKMAKEFEVQGVPKEEIASKVASLVPYTHAWVLQLLPSEYKQPEKVEAGKVSVKVLEQKRVNCEKCHVGTLNPQNWEGHILCPVCFERAQKGEFTLAPKKKEPEKGPSTLVEPPKVKELWRDRKARMQPQVSKMEELMRVALTERGVSFEMDVEFCVQSTTPDIFFRQHNLAVYVDGPVHEGREGRDSALRELLVRRHGVKVLSIPYDSTSKTEQEKILNQILSAISKGD